MNENIFYQDVNIEGEIHCDECLEVIHYHFDPCPVCKTPYAPSTNYCSPYEDYIRKEPTGCEVCGSEFLIVMYDCGDATLELLKRGKLNV